MVRWRAFVDYADSSKRSQIVDVMRLFLDHFVILLLWLRDLSFVWLFLRLDFLLFGVDVGKAFMKFIEMLFELLHDGKVIIIELSLLSLKVTIISKFSEIKISSRETLRIYGSFLKFMHLIQIFDLLLELSKPLLKCFFLCQEFFHLVVHICSAYI